MTGSQLTSGTRATPLGNELQPGLLEHFPTMVWVTNANGLCTYVNPAWLEFTGRELTEEVGDGWLEKVHPDDRPMVARKMAEGLATRQAFELEYRLQRCDGVYRWILDRGNPVTDAAGKFCGHTGFCHDTTEWRVIDASRREIEEQVQLLGLATRDMIWSWDARTNRVVQNAAFAEILGELPGPLESSVAWWKERVHPEDLQEVIASFEQARKEGQADLSHEYRFRKREGGYTVVDDRVCLLRDASGELVRVLGAMRDISKRKAAKEAQERFVRILETTSDFVGMYDANGGILYLNRAVRKAAGWPLEGPLVDRKAIDLHPGWANEILIHEGIPSAIAEGTWAGETALLNAEGAEIPVSQVIISHPGKDGAVDFVSTIMRDISDRKREEVARIEWANRYDAAIRASGQLLFDWNSFTGDITYAGDIERLLGFRMTEMDGGLDRFRQIIHPDDLPAFDDEIARVLANRDPFRLGFRMRRKNGREIDVDAKGYFFLDRQGRIGRMVGFLADVTAQKQAQEELARAHDSLEARVAERTAELARTYVVIQDRAHQQETVVHLGQRALAGAKLDELFLEATTLVRATLKVDFCWVVERSSDATDLVVRSSSGWSEDFLGQRLPMGYDSEAGYTLIAGEPVIAEDLACETRFRVSKPVRESGAASGISVIIQVGKEPSGVLCAFANERRAFTLDAVHFVQSVANVLTAAIDRRRAEESIRLAQEQAETANRAKSEFLSRMSHELRTPLNAILGFTQLLEIDQPTASQAESISHITRAGHHLLSLINEVLDIARIEAGRLALSFEPVEVAAFFGGVVELIRPLADRHDIGLCVEASCEQSCYITADRQRLQQVVLNLLSNAVKYNRKGGRVTVTCVSRGSEWMRIGVTDTGFGIAPEKMDRLFVPFERLGAEQTDIEGTGIGLALSQRIVAALHGAIGVDTVFGEGSTFWVDMPRAVTPAPEVDATPEAVFSSGGHGAPGSRTVLYIEDQDLNLRLVERILMHRPEYRLLSAMQGTLGLDLAREHRPDLILLDLNLPDLSGDEVLKRLKQDPELRDIPVVMVSADAMGERVEQLLALGATDYLIKPYRVADFYRVIEEALAPATEG